MIRLDSCFIFLLCLALLSACGSRGKENYQTDALVDSIGNRQLPSADAEIEPDNTETGCSYQNLTASTGIGLLCMPAKCKFYNNAQLTDLYMEWDLSMSDDPPRQCCALYYKPDYGIAHYVCLDTTVTYYHILVNGNLEKYVPRIYGKVFKDWFTYICGSVGGIDVPLQEKQDTISIMNEPVENAAVLVTNSELLLNRKSLCPMEIKGDWLRIKIDCYDFDENPHQGEPCISYIQEDCPESKTGWIRWKKGNKILIEIHQLL